MRCGNFARAAADMGLTAPAVSRSISRLEQHLELKLFHRTHLGAVLSEHGELLYRALEHGFAGIETAVKDMRASSGIAQTVTLSVSSAFVTHWFVPRLDAFQQAFPNIELRFHIIGGVLEGPLGDSDIAMRFDPPLSEQTQIVGLFPEAVLPVAAPVFAQSAGPERILPSVGRMINLSRAGTDWADLAIEFFEPQARGLTVSDYSVVVQAALLGQGVAMGWLNAVSFLLTTGQLVPVGRSILKTQRICALVHRKSPASPAIPRICEWIRTQMLDDVRVLHGQYPQHGFGDLLYLGAPQALRLCEGSLQCDISV